MAKNWSKTALAAAGSRTDDIFFLDDNSGWAVNSDGKVYLTQDGGTTWDFVNNAGARVPCENYVVRTVMDGESQSRIIRR